MSTYPINHIDDVLPHVQGRPDFVVADKGDYTVIDYVYAQADTFDHPARVECRGIKFGPDGRIIGRPFGKFFNIGERPEVQSDRLDFTRQHTVMEKLDGTMVHATLLNGRVVFMTRMGRTDHAIRAERHLTPAVEKWCRALLVWDYTPIFEWTAPDNRIVVCYEESALTLLAIRHTRDGYYGSREFCAEWATSMGVPLVAAPSSEWADADAFLAYARAITGAEGFVVRFADGMMVKAKGEDYVLKHRAKDGVSQEKNILALVLSGRLDDVLPLLDPADAEAARAYRDAVMAGVGRTAALVKSIVAANDNLDQKAFALGPASALPPALRALAFMVRKGIDPHEAVRARILAAATSQPSVDESRELHGATWAA